MKEVKARNQQLCKILGQGECEFYLSKVQNIYLLSLSRSRSLSLSLSLSLHSFNKNTAIGAD